MLIFAYYKMSLSVHFLELNNFLSFLFLNFEFKISNIGLVVEVDYHSQ